MGFLEGRRAAPVVTGIPADNAGRTRGDLPSKRVRGAKRCNVKTLNVLWLREKVFFRLSTSFCLWADTAYRKRYHGLPANSVITFTATSIPSDRAVDSAASPGRTSPDCQRTPGVLSRSAPSAPREYLHHGHDLSARRSAPSARREVNRPWWSSRASRTRV